MNGNVMAEAGAHAQEELDPVDAARLLDVSPDALAGWSAELEFPRNVGAADAPRYLRREVEALQATLPEAHSLPGAVRAARASLGERSRG